MLLQTAKLGVGHPAYFFQSLSFLLTLPFTIGAMLLLSQIAKQGPGAQPAAPPLSAPGEAPRKEGKQEQSLFKAFAGKGRSLKD